MSSYSYWIATNDSEDFESKLGLAGFVEEDGIWYFDADPERRFGIYLSKVESTGQYAAGIKQSNGATLSDALLNANGTPCYFEFHELANGGIAIKTAKTSAVTNPINSISMINFAVLPKISGEGFVYLYRNGSTIYFDTNDGIYNSMAPSFSSGIGQTTATMVHITRCQDGRGGFIDAEVYCALNLSPQQLYTQSFLFDIGEDTYLAGMGTNGSGQGMANRLVFKLAK